MQLTSLEISGFKSFGKKTTIKLDSAITSIVGPNGSGKSNVAEAIRFVLGEQSIKSMRGKQGSDLIFKGSSTLAPLARTSVTAIFDNRSNRNTANSEGVFSYLQFDEVRISRELYADGSNEYLINDTKVRLKDIQELLSTVNIGTTGHHIISQGEADRILTASARERKEMIEDALGLKLYQWRIRDAQRKLEKTDIHLREGEISRKEIAPHLNFLKRQVEKIEARREQAEELNRLYRVYLSREDKWIESEKSALFLSGGSQSLKNVKADIQSQIETLSQKISFGIQNTKEEVQAQDLEINLKRLLAERDDLYRSTLRQEAEQRVLEKSLLKAREYDNAQADKKSKVSIERQKASTISESLSSLVDQALWRTQKSEYAEVPNFLNLIKHTQGEFFTELLSSADEIPYIVADTKELEKEIQILKDGLHNERVNLEVIEARIIEQERQVSLNREQIEINKNQFHVEEKSLYELKNKLAQIEGEILQVLNKEEKVQYRYDRFVEEIKEGTALVGSSVLKYSDDIEEDSSVLESQSQVELYKKIERLKIKLEDTGVSNISDIIKEHEETLARDTFLQTEVDDLRKTKLDLETLIADLKQKLELEFETGITHINTQFGVFFTDMFGGGSAELRTVEKEKKSRKKNAELEDFEDEESQTEVGIDVHVALPQKKVRDLSMLSGGERALTSIALLFAITQVNPPPFLVLDETDAALDEANARRYGKSLRSLAKHSKLVVITHNRETMNQADSLYGVTVGKDGASKVLSVKFDEASEYAK